MTLDDDGWREVSDLLVGMFDRLAAIERDSVERLAHSESEPSQSTVVLMHFESPPVPEGAAGAEHHAGAVANGAAVAP
jgi:hypothetical protein